MSNRTMSDAVAVHGRDPQHLIEKIIRERIYDSLYWKEHCFGLSAATLMDKAVELTAVGGQYGNQQPTEFLCLVLKMLQLQPEKEIVVELIKQEGFKYLRALGVFYLRLVGRSKEIYQYLEPLLNDYRKLRVRQGDGFILSYMDVFVDQLLREERVCDVILPRLVARHILEENDELDVRVSALEDDLEDKEEQERSPGRRSRSTSRSRSRSRGRSRSRSRSRGRGRSRDSSNRTDSSRSRSSTPVRRRQYRSPSRSSSSSRSRSRSR